ncbi:nitroreductase family protein [Candidatus Amarobacter glycogenicus]|uniref:nitroreductase family protein n=1 Tax=Candidatus Amarobacter glycogenicus TaxID=3140699 RepID=UPI003134D37D|nr:nitroreductase family protein [Dehalococcoidia bacterium]
MSSDPGLFQTIYTTRALRRFKPDAVPDAVLFQLFDAAIRASSGQNAQDWRFIIIRDAQVKRQLRNGRWKAGAAIRRATAAMRTSRRFPATSASRSSASATLRCTWMPSPSSSPC